MLWQIAKKFFLLHQLFPNRQRAIIYSSDCLSFWFRLLQGRSEKKAFALAVCFPRRAPLHLGKTCLLFCYKVFYFISAFLSEKHEKQSASEFSSLSSIPCLLLAAPNVSQLSPETSPIYRLPDWKSPLAALLIKFLKRKKRTVNQFSVGRRRKQLKKCQL